MKKLYFIAILLILGCKSQKICTKEQADNIESTSSTKSTSIFDVQDTLIVPHICAKNGIYRSYDFKYNSWLYLYYGSEEFYMGGFYTDFLDCLMRAIDKGDEDAKKIFLDMTYRICNDIPNYSGDDESFERFNGFRYDYINKLPKKDAYIIYQKISEQNITTPKYGHNVSESYIYFIVKYFQNDENIFNEYRKINHYSYEHQLSKLKSDIKSGRIILDTTGYINHNQFSNK